MHMNDTTIRALIVEALDYASVYQLRHQNLADGFLIGERDVLFDDLDMDSLASMELCISIELNTGVSIVPEALKSLGTLNTLVDVLATELQ